MTMTNAPHGESYMCAVVRVQTPDGTLFVTVIEDDFGDPLEVRLSIGKTGSQVRAWTDAVQVMITMLLKAGLSIEDLIHNLSDITTGKITYHAGVIPIKSGPEGLAYALKIYNNNKLKLPKGFNAMARPPKLVQE